MSRNVCEAGNVSSDASGRGRGNNKLTHGASMPLARFVYLDFLCILGEWLALVISHPHPRSIRERWHIEAEGVGGRKARVANHQLETRLASSTLASLSLHSPALLTSHDRLMLHSAARYFSARAVRPRYRYDAPGTSSRLAASSLALHPAASASHISRSRQLSLPTLTIA